MNEFKLRLDKARESDNPVIHSIVSMIDSYLGLFKAMQKTNIQVIGNLLEGYERGIEGQEGYTPFMYGLEIRDPLLERKELLLKITTLYEILESHIPL